MPNATEFKLVALAVDRLNWARQFSMSLLETLSDEQLLVRAGDAGNHTTWIMGHIANTDDFIVSAMTGELGILPEHYGELFGGGSTPSDDAEIYPSRSELMEAMASARQRLIAWTESLDETSALAPTPESLQPLAPDAISVPITLAAHDLFHLGQVATIRSALGMSPVHA